MLNNIKCCGKPAQVFEDIDVGGSPGFGYICDECGNKAAHVNREEAEKLFMKGAKPAPKQPIIKPKKETKPMGNNLPTIQREKVLSLFHDKSRLLKIVSPIIDRDTGAMQRLVENNLRYVENLKGKGYDKLWSTEEGQLSLIRETEEAFMLGLEMGKAGDIVPFGDDCKFIPDVEGVIFALTHGNNAPFRWVEIDLQYSSDVVTSGRKTGNFFVDFESMGEERIDVVAVYVYGEDKASGLIKGDKYDANRLLDKACEHSGPYKNYRKIMNAFNHAKAEGKTETDPNGRAFFKFFVIKDNANDKYFDQKVEEFRKQEAAGTLKGSGNNQYCIQVLPKRDGDTWENKIYRRDIEGGMEEKVIYPDDLTNPYAGPDQPEMLRKTAGKSFLTKYLRTRNSTAAMNESRTHESVRDQALDMGSDVVQGESEEVI